MRGYLSRQIWGRLSKLVSRQLPLALRGRRQSKGTKAGMKELVSEADHIEARRRATLHTPAGLEILLDDLVNSRLRTWELRAIRSSAGEGAAVRAEGAARSASISPSATPTFESASQAQFTKLAHSEPLWMMVSSQMPEETKESSCGRETSA